MQLKTVTRILEAFGKAYWSEGGIQNRAQMVEAIQRGWQSALADFLRRYAFDHVGYSAEYARCAALAVEKYDQPRPNRDYEAEVWESFKILINATPEGKGANARNNPMAKTFGGKPSVIGFLCDTARNADYNLGQWAVNAIRGGRTKNAHERLTRIRGIGSKRASIYLRDVAVAFDVNIPNFDELKYVLPIERWTRWGAKRIATYPTMPTAGTDERCKKVIYEASRKSEANPMLVNTGLWYYGSTFARGLEEFTYSLTDASVMAHVVSRQKEWLEERSRTLLDRSRFLEEVAENWLKRELEVILL